MTALSTTRPGSHGVHGVGRSARCPGSHCRLARFAGAIILWCLAGTLLAPSPASRGGFALRKWGDGPGLCAEFVATSSNAQDEDVVPVERLHEHANVEQVFYAYGHVVNADDFAELAKIKSLRDVEIGVIGCGLDWATIDGDTSKLGALKQVERISLNIEGIKDDDLRFVAALPRLTCIEFNAGKPDEASDIKGPGCTDRCAEHLSRVVGLESLTILDAGDGFSDRFVDLLTAGTQKLEWLDLDAPSLTDESLRLLAERCPRLEHLMLGTEQLTDEGVRHLWQLENLRSLWLSSPKVTAKAVARIPGVRSVVLYGCDVSDQGAETFANLRDLERLVLYGPQFTDEQFRLFRNHPSLEEIILNGKRLTRDATLDVISSMPKLRSAIFPGNEALEQAVGRVLVKRTHTP